MRIRKPGHDIIPMDSLELLRMYRLTSNICHARHLYATTSGLEAFIRIRSR